jgi:two-component system chemotaxis response regulator CheV
VDDTVKQEILLESGTNEMEIIEFYVGAQPLGINVQKLKEIISYDESALTVIPQTEPAMMGALMMRGATLPLIDLKVHLKQRCLEEPTGDLRPVVLVCEFNRRINGFKVDGVNMIHRIQWTEVQPIAGFIDQFRSRFTGSVNIEGREILILDLEYIIGEFDPESVFQGAIEGRDELLESADKRHDKKVLMAEDSTLIRDNLKAILLDVGFKELETFVDGQACYERVLELKKQAEEAGEPIEKHLHLVISDVEMPKMDGLTLCRKIKEENNFRKVPVVLFSSLITKPMEHKCDSVGADGYASKPEVAKLIQIIDHYLGID